MIAKEESAEAYVKSFETLLQLTLELHEKKLYHLVLAVTKIITTIISNNVIEITDINSSKKQLSQLYNTILLDIDGIAELPCVFEFIKSMRQTYSVKVEKIPAPTGKKYKKYRDVYMTPEIESYFKRSSKNYTEFIDETLNLEDPQWSEEAVAFIQVKNAMNYLEYLFTVKKIYFNTSLLGYPHQVSLKTNTTPVSSELHDMMDTILHAAYTSTDEDKLKSKVYFQEVFNYLRLFNFYVHDHTRYNVIPDFSKYEPAKIDHPAYKTPLGVLFSLFSLVLYSASLQGNAPTNIKQSLIDSVITACRGAASLKNKATFLIKDHRPKIKKLREQFWTRLNTRFVLEMQRNYNEQIIKFLSKVQDKCAAVLPEQPFNSINVLFGSYSLFQGSTSSDIEVLYAISSQKNDNHPLIWKRRHVPTDADNTLAEYYNITAFRTFELFVIGLRETPLPIDTPTNSLMTNGLRIDNSTNPEKQNPNHDYSLLRQNFDQYMSLGFLLRLLERKLDERTNHDMLTMILDETLYSLLLSPRPLTNNPNLRNSFLERWHGIRKQVIVKTINSESLSSAFKHFFPQEPFPNFNPLWKLQLTYPIFVYIDIVKKSRSLYQKSLLSDGRDIEIDLKKTFIMPITFFLTHLSILFDFELDNNIPIFEQAANQLIISEKSSNCFEIILCLLVSMREEQNKNRYYHNNKNKIFQDDFFLLTTTNNIDHNKILTRPEQNILKLILEHFITPLSLNIKNYLLNILQNPSIDSIKKNYYQLTQSITINFLTELSTYLETDLAEIGKLKKYLKMFQRLALGKKILQLPNVKSLELKLNVSDLEKKSLIKYRENKPHSIALSTPYNHSIIRILLHYYLEFYPDIIKDYTLITENLNQTNLKLQKFTKKLFELGNKYLSPRDTSPFSVFVPAYLSDIEQNDSKNWIIIRLIYQGRIPQLKKIECFDPSEKVMQVLNVKSNSTLKMLNESVSLIFFNREFPVESEETGPLIIEMAITWARGTYNGSLTNYSVILSTHTWALFNSFYCYQENSTQSTLVPHYKDKNSRELLHQVIESDNAELLALILGHKTENHYRNEDSLIAKMAKIIHACELSIHLKKVAKHLILHIKHFKEMSNFSALKIDIEQTKYGHENLAQTFSISHPSEIDRLRDELLLSLRKNANMSEFLDEETKHIVNLYQQYITELEESENVWKNKYAGFKNGHKISYNRRENNLSNNYPLRFSLMIEDDAITPLDLAILRQKPKTTALLIERGMSCALLRTTISALYTDCNNLFLKMVLTQYKTLELSNQIIFFKKHLITISTLTDEIIANNVNVQSTNTRQLAKILCQRIIDYQNQLLHDLYNTNYHSLRQKLQFIIHYYTRMVLINSNEQISNRNDKIRTYLKNFDTPGSRLISHAIKKAFINNGSLWRGTSNINQSLEPELFIIIIMTITNFHLNNARDRFGNTLLHHAWRLGNPGILITLLSQRPQYIQNINDVLPHHIEDSKFYSNLCQFASKGMWEIVYLCFYPLSFQTKDLYKYNKLDWLQFINTSDEKENTILHVLCKLIQSSTENFCPQDLGFPNFDQCYGMIVQIIENGGDFLKENDQGESPFNLISELPYDRIVMQLALLLLIMKVTSENSFTSKGFQTILHSIDGFCIDITSPNLINRDVSLENSLLENAKFFNKNFPRITQSLIDFMATALRIYFGKNEYELKLFLSSNRFLSEIKKLFPKQIALLTNFHFDLLPYSQKINGLEQENADLKVKIQELELQCSQLKKQLESEKNSISRDSYFQNNATSRFFR